MTANHSDVAAFFNGGPQSMRLVWLPAAQIAALLDADVDDVMAAATASGHPVRGTAIGVGRTRALRVLRRLFESDAD